MEEITDKLKKFYRVPMDHQKPQIRAMSSWRDENRCGFLMGVSLHGLPEHVAEIARVLDQQSGQSVKKKALDALIRSFKEYYIDPYKQHAGTTPSSSAPPTRPPSAGSEPLSASSLPNPQSRSGSADSKSRRSQSRPGSATNQSSPVGSTGYQSQFRKALSERDGVCLFCWTPWECEVAHIIAQKNIRFAQNCASVMQEASLKYIHQVQNGLYLCSVCHGRFDKLGVYIDVQEPGRFVVRTVPTEEPHKSFSRNIEGNRKNYLIDYPGRETSDDWQRQIWFKSDDTSTYPNVTALEFHKRACLIWEMAGGADVDLLGVYESDDDVGDAGADISPLQKRELVEHYLSALETDESPLDTIEAEIYPGKMKIINRSIESNYNKNLV